MKCQCCDKNLSDYESTIKDAATGVYLDMCKTCLVESGVIGLVSLVDHPELDHEEEVDQEVLELN